MLICGSTILLEPKKDGRWRMHMAYCVLNMIIVNNMFLLPRIDDLINYKVLDISSS